jgi:hypothetical protein
MMGENIMHLQNNSKTKKYKFPKGEYYIGDLCYAIKGDDEWAEIMTAPNGNKWDLNEAKTYKGELIFSHFTHYGDGCYPNNYDDKEFWVDSGTIGIMPVSLITEEDWAGAVTMIFTQDFNVWYDNGTFHFGDYEIYTNDLDEVEYMYED